MKLMMAFFSISLYSDYIAAADERAGRLSRGGEEKKCKENLMTRSTETKSKKPVTSSLMKRSQSSPRVNSILKKNNQLGSTPSGMSSMRNGSQRNPDRKVEKKTVTIMQSG